MNATLPAVIQAQVTWISEPKKSKYSDGFYNSILFKDLSLSPDDKAAEIWKNLPSDDATNYIVGDVVHLHPEVDDNGKTHHRIEIISQANAAAQSSAAPLPTRRAAPPRSAVVAVADDKLEPPSSVGEWTIKQIQAALSRPLPDCLLATRKQGGKDLLYIPWHTANKILDKYAPGWAWEITKMHTTDKDLFLTGSLSIPAADGLFVRCATGTESLNCSSYGDPSSNAESMAFRRCAARFGLGLYLYDK